VAADNTTTCIKPANILPKAKSSRSFSCARPVLEEEIGDRAELAPAPPPEPTLADEPVPDGALTEIREALKDIKSQLATMTVSNTVKSEIHADIEQIEAETERPTPRRQFVKVFLESLRDNLAKVAATGLVATIGAILAKFFGVL
jgi:hypothetical protein